MPGDGFWPLAAHRGHEPCWSNSVQMTGQVEGKWEGRFVLSPSRRLDVFFAAGALVWDQLFQGRTEI